VLPGRVPARDGALTRADITGFHAAWARPRNTTLVIAADLNTTPVTSLIAQTIGRWHDPQPAAQPPGATPPQPSPAAVLADHPGAVQTQLMLAARIPGRGHPDWPALQVATHILGAPMTGRLDTRLRDQAGLSYCTHARLAELLPGTGLVLAGGAVTAEATIPALQDMLTIITTARDTGFTPAEHTATTGALIRTTPLGCETPGALAAITADLATSHLPADFADRSLTAIAALSPAQVTDAFRRHINPAQLTLIAVGDAATLEEPLRDIGLPAPLQVIPSAEAPLRT